VSAEPAGAAGGELLARLKELEGKASGPTAVAADPVNSAMIRHWVEAMGDENPVYVDEQAARANGFEGVVAPPTMLQAWIMRGYKASAEIETARRAGVASSASALDSLMSLLDDAGFTSVVATNCEQEYLRPLQLGDRLSANSVIESVSPEKSTALGAGHFVTTRIDFSDEHGEPVATMRFRILRFRPRHAGEQGPGGGAGVKAAGERPSRPAPAITRDNSFFFEGAKQGKLLIQRCASCGRLRHPPRPSCSECGSMEWDTVESSGRGTVFSYVVVHHPQVPGFDYPLPIGLVELEEGTRLVADLLGVSPGDVWIGMPVDCELVAVDEGLTLPMFRPARADAGRVAAGSDGGGFAAASVSGGRDGGAR